ncbi:MAG: hypothetical protein BWX68_03086 [Verrucomicrobia bacterium ADurb.Bin063]|nr:MAG: hypothetical protein BWX68_03086 [Verrucomicrobia bacterium ADurb.Bin063]
MLARHFRLHRLRTKRKHLNSLAAVGDRQIFRHAHRCVLGDGVRQRSDLTQQPGRGSRNHDRAAAAPDHSGNDRPRHEDMRENINFPDALPGFVIHFVAADGNDAGVGAKKVNAAVAVFREFHQTDDIRFFAHVADKSLSPHFRGDGLRARFIDVGGNDGLRAFFCKPPAQTPADAGSRPGHNDRFPFDLHFPLT